MKKFTFAVLGTLLLAGTDVAAAAISAPEEATSVTTVYKTEVHSGGGWAKRKKRRNTPAYHRHARLRHR